MFVKETKVKRSGREYSYLQLVEGYRDENGKVRHRVVANLGRKDALKDSGSWRRWRDRSRVWIRRWPGRAAASVRCCWSSTSFVSSL